MFVSIYMNIYADAFTINLITYHLCLKKKYLIEFKFKWSGFYFLKYLMLKDLKYILWELFWLTKEAHCSQ